MPRAIHPDLLRRPHDPDRHPATRAGRHRRPRRVPRRLGHRDAHGAGQPRPQRRQPYYEAGETSGALTVRRRARPACPNSTVSWPPTSRRRWDAGRGGWTGPLGARAPALSDVRSTRRPTVRLGAGARSLSHWPARARRANRDPRTSAPRRCRSRDTHLHGGALSHLSATRKTPSDSEVLWWHQHWS